MRYVANKIMTAIFLTLVVSVLVFLLMRALPGDPALIALGDSATIESIAAYRHHLGLDLPLTRQYWRWISGVALHFDFGQSVLNQQDVSEIVRQRLPNTLTIGIPSLVLGVLTGIPTGIATAIFRGRGVDQLITLVINSFLGTPRFLIALFGVLVLALKWRLIPLQGYTAPWDDFAAYLHKAAWPIIVNSIYIVAVVARHTRSNLLEVMNQDYIRTARANGLSEWRIVFGHALKNTLIPVLTVIGLEMPQIVGGAVVIETIFNIPGIGQLVLNGVVNRDYLVVQAAVLVISLVTVSSNLAVEVLYGLVDPRIRRGAR
ncbi:ABC transporter permease [Lichenicola cladoniae]|nr:ABC transporter permease [Lichenicola cladoniae]